MNLHVIQLLYHKTAIKIIKTIEGYPLMYLLYMTQIQKFHHNLKKTVY